MKKPFIPFGWLPGHWGLTGVTREIAEAEYTHQYDDYARESKVIDIKIKHANTSEMIRSLDLEKVQLDRFYDVITEEEFDYKRVDLTVTDDKERQLRRLELDVKYKKISLCDFEYKQIELLDLSVTDKNIQLNELDFKYQKIGINEYEKRKASYNGEGWVNVIKIETDNGKGSFELDWNEHFITELKSAGFEGTEEEDIVNQWFSKICRDIAMEEYSGTGDFDEVMEERELVKRRKISDDKWEVK